MTKMDIFHKIFYFSSKFLIYPLGGLGGLKSVRPKYLWVEQLFKFIIFRTMQKDQAIVSNMGSTWQKNQLSKQPKSLQLILLLSLLCTKF